ncbi:MAG: TrkH family potassium uptake protein [Treponema sp.]|jgi:trk system potassium uptake protein TrkH|nr:TrkH family potassium uptake protein [Treponema sp.]
MRFLTLLRVLSLILGTVAPMMLPSLVFAAAAGERVMIRAFSVPMGAALIAALPALFLVRRRPLRLSQREGFLLVFLAWIFISLFGALPYFLSGSGINITDAVFESTCSFATTGGTTIDDVERLPRSLLFWRSMGHWFGGMGIVLLTVALMPLLGVGGFQLVKAETPGPEKEKITPRLTNTAKVLWLAYSGLTILLVLLYMAGGMGWFDALCHGLTTMASGGVSTRNGGIAVFNSLYIDMVTMIFMLLAGLNFSLYYRMLKGKFREVFCNTEGRAYFFIFAAAAAVLTVTLVPFYGSAGRALRFAAYQAASILSTTGSAITDYTRWPPVSQLLLFGLMFVGGCSGSTAGGIKVIRHVVLWKQAGNELRRTVYRRGIFSVQLNRKVGRRDVIYGVAGFVSLYMMVVAATALLTAASGVDFFSALSAAVSVTGNVGIGFGAVGPVHHYGAFAAPVKWLYSFVMIAGRLELWAVFVLFSGEFRR